MRYQLRFAPDDDPMQVPTPASVPWLRGLLGAVFALALAAVSASAQAGTITGQVTAASSGAPMSAVQVYLAGIGTGTLTNSAGRYLLLNVPAGTYTIQVERIGYGRATQEVTVAAGETVTRDFSLGEEALGLDELVVTGTAGASRRREVGNSISQINVAAIDEPVVSVDNLLQGRSAGVTVLDNTGQAGGGASIRLRGNVSAAMSNQPLIYIDGVRVRSDGLPKNVAPVGYGGHGPNTSYSPLNDISPNDILRIEVIKGAAAATLFGTEAASGVIQIFTKRGQPGRTRWALETNVGAAVMQKFGPTEGLRGEPLTVPANEDRINFPVGPDDPSYMFLDHWRRTGFRQKHAISMSGGNESTQYFLSGSWEDYKGVQPKDRDRRFNVRGNLTFEPLSNLEIRWNTSYARANIDQLEGGTGLGLHLQAFTRDRNYFGSGDTAVISQTLIPDWNTSIDHLVTGVTANYTPRPFFTNRVTVGYDLVQQEASQLIPYGFYFNPTGNAHNNRFVNRTFTVDYAGTLTHDLTDQLRSSLSFGGQSVQTDESTLSAYGTNFPGPGNPTVSSGAVRDGYLAKMRVVTAGAFVQEVLGYRDRYFLTAGVRVDGNSAFGGDLGLQAYPKVSASYVISDEPFWPEQLGQVKLRAAWGQAGRAPGAFDAVRTWNPVGWGEAPAFFPNNLGNPTLGPERTAEIEAGADASLLGDRLSVSFTYYNQRTTDALFRVTASPSSGFGGSQLENVGELENKGIELEVNGTLLERRDWSVDLGGSLSTNFSKVLDLGGAPPFSMGMRAWIVEGQPVPVMRARCIVNPDEIAPPRIESDCNIGPNLPTHIVGLNASVRFPYGIQLTARGEYQKGAYAYSVLDGEETTRGIRWPQCFNAYPLIDAGNIDQLTALERAMCIASNANRDWNIYPMDFFKLREVTVSAPLPFSILGDGRADVVVSARNAYRWKKANDTYMDPESAGGFQRGSTGMEASVRSVGGGNPPPAIFTFALRLTY